MNEQSKLIDWFRTQIGPGKRFETLNDMARFLGLGKTKHTKLYGFLDGADTQHKTVFEWMEQLGLQVAYPDAKMEDFDLVGKVCARAGAGSSLVTSDKLQAFYAFRKDFLTQEGIHADDCVMMDVMGPSMEPLIMDGDTILIDKRDVSPRDGSIYVVGFEEDLLVKRLQRIPGGWTLHSENPNYSDVPVTGEDVERLRVYGRVRWFGRVL